ncbi:MAG TPA: ankyrin repeat domain-containing protein [Pyrinomonadaceae bacterium]
MRRTVIISTLLVASMALAACGQQSTLTPPSPQTVALLRAAREGNADTVKALLASQDTNVDATDEQGNTALIEAARYGHDDVALALLAAGANTKARDRNGKTALMLAVEGGHDDVVRVLKQAGAAE